MIERLARFLLPSSWRDALLLGLFALAAIPFLSGFESSLDAPFHLEMGRRILDGDFPRTNAFAMIDSDRPWQDDDALFQVFFALAHGFGEGTGVGGAVGVALFRILLVGGTLGLALSIRPGSLKLTAPLAAVFLFGIDERIAARPEWLSAFLLMLTMRLLVFRAGGGSPADGPAGWALPAIVAVWANGHGYFILGQFLVALWAVGPRAFVRPARADDPGAESHDSLFEPGSRIRRLLLALLCIFAAAATPYGGDTLMYPVRVLREVFMGDAGIQSAVEEFARFPWSESGIPLAGLLGLAAAASMILFLPFSIDRGRTFSLLSGLSLFACALVARRNLAIFLLAAIPVLADALDPIRPARLLSALRGLRESQWLSRLPEAVLAAAIIASWAGAFFSNALPIANATARGIRDAEGRSGLAPDDAGAYWARKNLGGPLLNNFNAGAWIIGEFRGEQKVFIDGRPEVYGAEFFRFYRDVMAGRVPLRVLERRHGIRAMFLTLPFSDSLAVLERAAQDPAWEVVFLDPRAAIVVRAGMPSHESAIEDPRIVTNPAAGGDPRLMRAHGRALLAQALGLSRRGPEAREKAAALLAAARAALASAAEKDPDARLDAAVCALAAGAPEEAKALAGTLRRRRPGAVSILARIDADLGRPRDALARLEEGTRRFPRASGLALQRAQVLAEAGRLEEAAAACRQVRARGLDDPLPFEIEAEALLARGGTLRAEARAVLDEGLARFPFALGLRRLDAVLRAGLRDPAAMAAADALSLDYPGEPEAWFALGETANLLGEFARAKEAFERALELAPRGPFARRAKDRIRALEALHRAAPGR